MKLRSFATVAIVLLPSLALPLAAAGLAGEPVERAAAPARRGAAEATAEPARNGNGGGNNGGANSGNGTTGSAGSMGGSGPATAGNSDATGTMGTNQMKQQNGQPQKTPVSA
jgi:hypothetical protein